MQEAFNLNAETSKQHTWTMYKIGNKIQNSDNHCCQLKK